MERRKRSEVGTRVPSAPDLVEKTDVMMNEVFNEAMASEKVQASLGRLISAADAEAAEQRAGEQAFASAAGDEGQPVEVTIGDKLFQPIQYHGCRVGPFKGATVVRKGETIATAMLRLHREMEIAVREIHKLETDQYVEDLAALIRKTKDTRL